MMVNNNLVDPGWWCNNHLEKYEFVNGKDDIPYMKWNIKHVPNHQSVVLVVTLIFLCLRVVGL